jgi:hypothetical protein
MEVSRCIISGLRCMLTSDVRRLLSLSAMAGHLSYSLPAEVGYSCVSARLNAHPDLFFLGISGLT